MRAQFLHLSGPLRGQTDTPQGPEVLIGTAADADVRFPATPAGTVAAHHARIAFDDCGCDFLIRALDGQVFVNHQEIREAFVLHGDLIEFGVGGPKARFKVWAAKGRPCKPVRIMVDDALEVGRQSGLLASSASLVRDLLTQATLSLKVGFPLLVLGLAGVAFGLGWVGGGSSVEQRLVAELDAVRGELVDLRDRQRGEVTREEIDAIRSDFAAAAAEVERLASQRDTVREIVATASRAVCLLHGVWGMRTPARLRDLRGEYLTEPSGDRLEVHYTGSGFHVGVGQIVTNRHVALPWEGEKSFERLLDAGFEPVMLAMTATFPGIPPLVVDTAATRARDSDRIDVAVLRAAVPEGVPTLTFDTRSAAELRGETVLVVGYPTGVNALLAKAEPAVARAIVAASGGDLGQIIDGLAAKNAVTPVITRGVLSEVRESRLVYDAETTSGGSGGPVFGADGRVIGVNFAITVGFDASNFGVPARFVAPLLQE